MKQDSFSKKYIKSHLGTAYSVARSIRNTLKQEKAKKASAINDNATHGTAVSVDTPIKKIFVEPAVKRFNVIVLKLNQSLSDSEKTLLVEATKLANGNNYELRIISRNCLPNPKYYNELLSTYNIKRPNQLSFYTDWRGRVSSPIYALEVTSSDVFFADINELKEWGRKNG